MSFESTSIHEAGHAALFLLAEDIFGAPRLITALPVGDSVGFILPSGDELTDFGPGTLRAYGRMLAAGSVAERLAGFSSGGIGSDMRLLGEAAELAKRGEDFIRECFDGAEYLLRLHWPGVLAIAKALRTAGGTLKAPHGIELARTELYREPKRPFGLGTETFLRLAPSLVGVPELAGYIEKALASVIPYYAPRSKNRTNAARLPKPASTLGQCDE
jgi:hypothetical protein